MVGWAGVLVQSWWGMLWSALVQRITCHPRVCTFWEGGGTAGILFSSTRCHLGSSGFLRPRLFPPTRTVFSLIRFGSRCLSPCSGKAKALVGTPSKVRGWRCGPWRGGRLAAVVAVMPVPEVAVAAASPSARCTPHRRQPCFWRRELKSGAFMVGWAGVHVCSRGGACCGAHLCSA